jgi:hypothetical protein
MEQDQTPFFHTEFKDPTHHVHDKDNPILFIDKCPKHDHFCVDDVKAGLGQCFIRINKLTFITQLHNFLNYHYDRFKGDRYVFLEQLETTAEMRVAVKASSEPLVQTINWVHRKRTELDKGETPIKQDVEELTTSKDVISIKQQVLLLHYMQKAGIFFPNKIHQDVTKQVAIIGNLFNRSVSSPIKNQNVYKYWNNRTSEPVFVESNLLFVKQIFLENEFEFLARMVAKDIKELNTED